MRHFHLYLYGPDCGPIESTFQDAAERLQTIGGLYFEPDGSFVWSPDAGKQSIYGMLYDANDQLQYVELWGSCDFSTWQQVMGSLVGPVKHDLAVMSLPQRQLQDLQSFEETTFC